MNLYVLNVCRIMGAHFAPELGCLHLLVEIEPTDVCNSLCNIGSSAKTVFNMETSLDCLRHNAKPLSRQVSDSPPPVLSQEGACAVSILWQIN